MITFLIGLVAGFVAGYVVGAGKAGALLASIKAFIAKAHGK